MKPFRYYYNVKSDTGEPDKTVTVVYGSPKSTRWSVYPDRTEYYENGKLTKIIYNDELANKPSEDVL